MMTQQNYHTLAATIAGLARTVEEAADQLAAKALALPPTAAEPSLAELQAMFRLLVHATISLQDERERLEQSHGVAG